MIAKYSGVDTWEHAVDGHLEAENAQRSTPNSESFREQAVQRRIAEEKHT
jgi:hypothetical protein